MAYFIDRECSCGVRDSNEVTEKEFNEEIELDVGGCMSVFGDNDTITYHVHSCTVCRKEADEEEIEEELKT